MNKNIRQSFSLVFTKKDYIILALIIALLFFLVGILIPGIPFLKLVFSYTPPEFLPRLKAVLKVWDFFKSNSTLFSRYLLFFVAILTGINLSMFIFYLKRRIKLEKSVGTGFFGIVIGLLGVGCASCGSVVLSSLFGYTAVTGFLGILPFKGKEIGFVGLALLLTSIYLIADKIQNPNSCKIEN
ncbi:hypothetical protein KKH39_01945 [Patescibacteria group bacterium]|nr:hypothetical protein [Patescibacteria group bacterium]